MVGSNSDSRIEFSYATGNVTGDGDYVGGLVGNNNYHSWIEFSYATGDVSGGSRVGGLVGYNDDGSIGSSYATGTVTGGYNGVYVGGLVGYNDAGSIDFSYAIRSRFRR